MQATEARAVSCEAGTLYSDPACAKTVRRELLLDVVPLASVRLWQLPCHTQMLGGLETGGDGSKNEKLWGWKLF